MDSDTDGGSDNAALSELGTGDGVYLPCSLDL
jgi:hypothetical protein